VRAHFAGLQNPLAPEERRAMLERSVSAKRHIIKGTGVSAGIAHGNAYVLACTEKAAAPRRSVATEDVATELARFEAALDRAERELLHLKSDVAERIGSNEADIFLAQAMVVRDRSFHSQVVDIVRGKLVNTEAALAEVIDRFTHNFDTLTDAYLRERAADIRDVGRRVLDALIERSSPEVLDVPPGSIVVTDELLPSSTARLQLDKVRAFVTERGGKFSHTSILARSMRTPAVTGIPDASLKIKTGDRLIVDGVSGVVFINPDDRVRAEYDRLESELRSYQEGLRELVDLPSVTRDGTAIPLLANASKLADTEAAMLYRAEGIGLYRTEFAFSVRGQFPSEEEQFEILKMAAERVHPRKIVLRLLDIGGDKTLSYFPLPASRNPSLARRGIRLLLDHPEVLERQLRAFLRVSGLYPVSILLPVVGGIEEVRETRAVIRRVSEQLRAEGIAFDASVAVGAMIEVPSAALLTPVLAKEVDFFSLGTNDLVQYVLAADREDETVADYYLPHHPAVLRLLKFVAESARQAGRPLTICGEMAGDATYTALLLGLGLGRSASHQARCSM
jgi:phosphotransferase system enzyme I (PtsI)